MSTEGYVNYFEILGVADDANAGEVRKNYKKLMRNLVGEIARVEITGDRRDRYLLDMAKLNAAVYLLRDKAKRADYTALRDELIELERRWCDAEGADPAASDELRREFDGKVRSFLSKYVEEAMLEAGRDKGCVEASHWDADHERHASRILRYYRHRLYQDILERVPFSEVTRPGTDWDERRETVAELIREGTPES